MVTINLWQEIADFEADLDEEGKVVFESINFKRLPVSRESIQNLLADKRSEIQEKYATKALLT